MKKWLRRIRGAIKMGLTWGFAWFAAGLVIMLGVLLFTGSTGADVPYPIGFGLLGFLAGITFSTVVVTLGGRRRFDQMSLPRFTTWGGIGGALFAVIFVFSAAAYGEGAAFLQNLVFLGPLFATIGAGSASGLLVLARKAEDRDLLDSGGPTSLEPH